MGTRTTFQSLLVGKDHIPSRNVYKYALLRGQIAFLLAVICFLYIPIDIFHEVYDFLPWYVMGLTVAALIIFFNRIGNYLVSTLILTLFSNLFVYFFAAVDNPASGVFFFFIATATIGLVLFYPINKVLAIGFVLLSMALALLASFSDFSPIPPPVQTPEHIKINFTVNLVMGFLASLLVILFIIRRNDESEKSMLAHQDHLEKLASKLESSEVRFRMALEGSMAGLYEWNIQTNSVFVSNRWKELLGYDTEQPIDVDVEFFLSLVHPEDLKRSQKSIENAIANGESYQNELRMKRKDGSYIWVQDSGIIKMENNKPLVAVGAIIDIEDRRKAEESLLSKNVELEKINEELDRFVYSASHDMRAPLSTLLGLLQLAKLSRDPDELEEYFDMMINRIHTMEGFIKEVTDYSRNARIDLVVSRFNLKELVQNVVDSFDYLAQEAVVKVAIDIPDELELHTDEIRLKVILNNLLANGIKYGDPMKPSKWVKIEADFKGNDCLIQVRDNGIGIRTEYFDKIFDMFFRASEESTGSGLGLYIVKETLERLNGQVTCQSSREEGSVFEIIIPSVVVTEKELG